MPIGSFSTFLLKLPLFPRFTLVVFSYSLWRLNQSYLQRVLIFNEAIKFKMDLKSCVDSTAFETIRAEANRLCSSLAKGQFCQKALASKDQAGELEGHFDFLGRSMNMTG